ncbi:MAG TPA: carboxypeptidase-like regulatory domain-containing protein, partial [Bryobacteraceae bacterium]|nr:carboxypeptidase-like regulatory domain-containing protein [Bryobacteraceae bacterium]
MSPSGYRRALVLAATLVCFALLIQAQTGNGVVRGTIYDPTRATIPNVKIVLTHIATNTSREAPSNEIGFFLFTALPPGEYKLTAETTGFKKWAGTLTIVAGQTAVVEPSLEIGSLESVVEVTGAAPVINTESTEV